MVSFNRRGALGHGEEHLDAALAEGPLADDQGPLLVLERAGDDLAGAGRVLVHQHDQRQVTVVVVLLGLVDRRRVAGHAVGVGADDDAVGEELVAGLDRRGQKAAGVVAQVQDDAAAAGLFDRFHGLLQLLARVLGEVGEAHVGDLLVGVHEPVPAAAGLVLVALDAGDVDHLPLDGVVLAVAVGAADGQDDGGALLAGDGLDGLVDADALGVLAVDLGDDVAGLDPGLVGGAVLERAHDLEAAVLVALDLDAHAAELAAGGLAELLNVGRPDHAAERVQLGEGAVGELADQHLLRQVHRVAVGGLDLLQRVAQDQLLGRVRGVAVGVGPLVDDGQERRPLGLVAQVRESLLQALGGGDGAQAVQPAQGQVAEVDVAVVVGAWRRSATPTARPAGRP